ncbi:YkgJ family cysteine cluster protein [Pontibacillus halophilus]|uniref:YkgJ family cysteine cluster protein n=1 Tax=Pontibacillus halophilus TaxID=516704 RepID=UPI001E3CB470|nr:YkgJ family cysteine cluster protein [Pontibacillus halophilus]
MIIQSYLSYPEILKKCELLNEQYEINQHYFDHIVEDLLSSDRPTNEVIMAGFHRLLEQVNEEMANMEDFMDVKASCFMGCAFCCYFPIIITQAESSMMKRAIDQWPKERKEKLMKHLEQYYATYGEEVERITALDQEDPAFKKKYIASQVPCPMLDPETNLCMAYEIRPIPCRTYVNYSDPKVCANNHMPKETLSFEFLYEFYMGGLNEIMQELYENGEDMLVDYPSDMWQYDFLANWAKDWLREEESSV